MKVALELLAQGGFSVANQYTRHTIFHTCPDGRFQGKTIFFIKKILTKIIWKCKEISCIFVMSIIIKLKKN